MPIDAFSLLADLPTINANYLIGVVSRVVHVLTAIIIGGGLFYMRTVLAPSGPEACFSGRRDQWARWMAAATGLSLVAGLYNFMATVSASKAAGDPLPSAYHMLFGAKFVLGLFVMFVASVLPGKTALADKFRANMSRWLGLAWSAVIAIVVLGAIMRTLH